MQDGLVCFLSSMTTTRASLSIDGATKNNLNNLIIFFPFYCVQGLKKTKDVQAEVNNDIGC